MANLRNLAERVTALSKAIPQEVSDLGVKVASAIVKNLVYDTPVDVSTAVSNWVVGLGEPNGTRKVAIVPGFKGSTGDASAAAALALAMALLKTKRPGESIWISNNLAYIRRLNDGYSHQAPAGFVERAQLIGRKTAEQGI